jgi:acyl transferase domain-containing protein
LTIAETLVRECPDRLAGWLYRSEALYGLGQIVEATQKLFPALGTDLYKHWQVKYALAQYATQQSQFKAAYAFLQGAFDVADSPELKVKALDDPLLAPLWKKIGEL